MIKIDVKKLKPEDRRLLLSLLHNEGRDNEGGKASNVALFVALVSIFITMIIFSQQFMAEKFPIVHLLFIIGVLIICFKVYKGFSVSMTEKEESLKEYEEDFEKIFDTHFKYAEKEVKKK